MPAPSPTARPASSPRATNSFFLANGTFAKTRPDILKSAIDALGQAGDWANRSKDKVAESPSAATGVPVEIQKLTAERGDFTATPLTPQIVAMQQVVADRFAGLGLIPDRIDVASRVWSSRQR